MDKDRIYKKLNTNVLGRNIIIYDSLDSTQKEIKRKISLDNGTVIIAESQTSGKGTHGRIWYSKDVNKNISMTYILYPNCQVKKLVNLTLIIAECIVNSIYKLYNIKLSIKYPNDIVYNGKKIGGILTETEILGDIVHTLYIGIGLNILQEEFNYEIKDIASSLKKEFNIEFSREDIISEFFNNFEKKYYSMLEDKNE